MYDRGHYSDVYCVDLYIRGLYNGVYCVDLYDSVNCVTVTERTRNATEGHPFFKDVPLVELLYLVFTRMPSESYSRQLRSLWLCQCMTSSGP